MKATPLTFKDQLAVHGYAFLREYRPEMEAFTLASVVGEPLTPWEGRLVQQLIPRVNGAPNTYSGIYGLKSFPFHTDLAHWRRPPRYLLLRCIKGYHDVPTLLLDGRAIIDAVTLNVLTRAIVKPRRPRNGEISLLRLCEQVDGGHRLRWDEVFLKSASNNGQFGSEQIRAYLSEAKPQCIALANPGDTLLVDNWRMLHARSPITPGRGGRHIERVYLETLK